MELIFSRSWLTPDTAVYYCLLLLVWFSLWRFRTSDPTRKGDFYILAGLLAWENRFSLRHLIKSPVTLLYGTVIAGVASALYSGLRAPEGENKIVGDLPWLLPSRTTHARLFPKVHSFGYTLLQAAIPVGSEGRFGSLISVGNVRRKAWYHVQASDYLERGSEDANLHTKLREYLRSQNVQDHEWEYAWLITAPRFLGYSFNPVSFWYIYTAQDVLDMMILEVNNTFGERRMYLLRTKDNEERSQDGQSDAATSEIEGADFPLKFQNAWAKDFHVSPFNSRKGFYMLTATDPFQEMSTDGPVFHNCITLKSSKNHVKLVARLFSAGKAINPCTAGQFEMARFIILWFWVGFMTFPRILKQAASLFWSRGLHVWLRPEVLPTSIGRQEEVIETELCPYFESYLKTLVAKYTKPIRVHYSSNMAGMLPCILTNVVTDLTSEIHEKAEELQIRILTPAFFGRFVHYAHAREAFDRECIFTDEKNRTAWVSRPDVVSSLIKTGLDAVTDISEVNPQSPFECLRWNIHRLLRCPPARPAYSFSESHGSIRDIRKMPFSPLDRFVMTHQPNEAWRYRRLCGRLFLAQRLAFGFVPIVDLVDVLIRVMITWQMISAFSIQSVNVLPLAAAVHIYAFAKGL